MEGVVGDEPLPHQVPERVDRFGRIAAARRLVERGEERRAFRSEVIDDRPLALGDVDLPPAASAEPRQVIGQVERQPSVAIADRLDAAPDDFARGAQRIEIGGLVALDARRQDLGFEDRRRQRRALQVLDRVEQRIEAGRRRTSALPAGQQAARRPAAPPARPACAARASDSRRTDWRMFSGQRNE